MTFLTNECMILVVTVHHHEIFAHEMFLDEKLACMLNFDAVLPPYNIAEEVCEA